MPIRPIVITGFMCAGKSTLALALAERLSCGVVDLDEAIQQSIGLSPREIIQREGEARFREIESRELKLVLNNSGAKVIALGGGTWIIPENRVVIERAQAFSVWLDPPFDLCWERIVESGDERPLAGNIDQAQQLFEMRRPIYALANLRVEVTSEHTQNEIVHEVLQAAGLPS